ncbi:hypothetical protein [Desertivirga arenae]|uniref:hypothetical protein n=1 Tax=Desertivirga arenae TaxID=2810309 RepID=UPI001A9646A3|nr:hypothetical protein [Pedobacter sp. SYSU D00823]
MNTEENDSLENQEREVDKPAHDNTVDNSNKSANKNDYDSDMERYQQAIDSSEPSFTIAPEKGLTPEPETLNTKNENEGNNVKK